MVNDAKNIAGFADGHVSFLKFYLDSTQNTFPCFYNPPASYDYQWGED